MGNDEQQWRGHQEWAEDRGFKMASSSPSTGRAPDKPTGVWDFNLDLAGALEQLKRAEEWLLENEMGRSV